MTDDELRELFKDAPKFEHMERGELVAHAYGLFAAGNKAGAENAKLREQGVRLFDKTLELEEENAKLRELVSLYHYGATHEASPSDVLAWSAKVDSLRRELGIEADDE